MQAQYKQVLDKLKLKQEIEQLIKEAVYGNMDDYKTPIQKEIIVMGEKLKYKHKTDLIGQLKYILWKMEKENNISKYPTIY